MKESDSKHSFYGPAFINIAAIGIALLFAQLPVRSFGLGFGLQPLTHPVYYLPRLLLASYYDVIFGVVLTIFFLAVLRIAGQRSSCGKTISIGFFVVAVLSVVVALMDAQFRSVAGTPFSYQWLYYSDFLLSHDARETIQANLSWAWVAYGLLLFLGFSTLFFLAKGGIARLLARAKNRRALVLAAVGICATYLPAAHWYVKRPDSPDGSYDNGLFYFLKSCLTARDHPAIFTMQHSFGSGDFLPVSERPPESSLAPHDPRIKNVILFVLESVGAEYVETFGGKYPVTPTLTRYQAKAASFDKIYVPVPMTVNSLWSLECSRYPWISYKLLVREFPKIEAPSLSGELHRRGSQTAFFNSSDNRYQHADVFLAARGFQTIEDCRTVGRGQPLFHGTQNDHSEDGCDDRVTAAAFNDWIDAQNGQPFFGMLWTVMTHYPYFVNGPEIDYGTGDVNFNRYLNALRLGDQALGKVLAHLEERGLMDSTLVVVIGDHGESFGQHNGWCHDNIYDQCVHVPLLFINPRLFHGETYSQIGSSVDIAPTILDILGHELPGAWQGRSLFSADRTGRAYFFEPFSGYMFGFREGDYACLSSASRDKFEVYDMAKDPFQKNNLAARKPEIVLQATERLASWAQFQNEHIERLIVNASAPVLPVAHPVGQIDTQASK